ncbi:transglycosylase SLT domain-containing protein [Pacificimonas sp. ICDLI1SI03]
MTVNNLSLAGLRPDIASAIRDASAQTGIDAEFLTRQAQVESNFNPHAKAATSSATGLYQFIDQTWLETVRKHGNEHGLGWAADRIERTPGGRYSAGNAEADILALRTQPAAAAAMAAAFAADNRDHLESQLGREVDSTDLYMAHFLGAAGAAAFLKAKDEQPNQPAANILPAAARANRSVFFAASGTPRSLSEIHQRFARKFDERGTAAMPTRMASASAPKTAEADALSSTRRWIAARANGTADISAQQITPTTARLLYLSLTSTGSEAI